MRPDPAIVETFLRYARRLAARGYVHNTLGNIVMRVPHPDYPHGVAYTKHAELSLEREPPRGYDVMGIDAFSGDSIPMHLITREAMALYVKHLKPDGVIVFQATTRFIDLLPVVKRLAEEFGMEAVNISDSPDVEEAPQYCYSATDQVIVTRNQKLLAWPTIDDVSDEIEDRPDLPTFTDSHHNLLRILK